MTAGGRGCPPKSLRRPLIGGLALAGLVVLALLLSACHPNVAITYENRTQRDVLVSVNDGGFEEIKAGTTSTFTYLIDGHELFVIVAKTKDGEIFFHETLTREELERRRPYRITFQDSANATP